MTMKRDFSSNKALNNVRAQRKKMNLIYFANL